MIELLTYIGLKLFSGSLSLNLFRYRFKTLNFMYLEL
nr:MAG TPA: hypothetical protein [Caudoviricetes sp.]